MIFLFNNEMFMLYSLILRADISADYFYKSLTFAK